MIKRIPLILGATAVVLFAGCSNPEEDFEVTEQDTALEAAPEIPGNPAVERALTSLDADLEAKKYDDLTQGLAFLNSVPMSKVQEDQYLMKVREVHRSLMVEAQTNPQARQAFERFGQAMTGR